MISLESDFLPNISRLLSKYSITHTICPKMEVTDVIVPTDVTNCPPSTMIPGATWFVPQNYSALIFRHTKKALQSEGFNKQQSAMKGSRIELGDITHHVIKQLRCLNQVIFPVGYNDKFYKDVLEVGELAKLAYFNDIAVGAVCCRVEHAHNKKRLYIMTLGCLAAYRRLGLGTRMLQHILDVCRRDGSFDNIYLHVHTSNQAAIDFYQKFGFKIVETKKDYYKKLEPTDAYVLQKSVRRPTIGEILRMVEQ